MDDHPAGVEKRKRLNSALKITLPARPLSKRVVADHLDDSADEVTADPTANFEPEPHEATTGHHPRSHQSLKPLHQKRHTRICLSQL
ncbi:hypothetical protein L208DRAFT_1407469, partial [Tricholoma matsutake]